MVKKVMIVDDDKGILEAMKAVYQAEGYDVCVDTYEGKGLYSKLKKKTPDLLVMDVFLLNDDGREIVKKLKQNKYTSNIPVLMTSARDDVKDSVLQSGASFFMSKPFDVDELLDTSERLIE